MANDVISKTNRGELPDTFHPMTPEQRAKREARRVAEGVIQQSREAMKDRRNTSLAERHAAATDYQKAARELNYDLVPPDSEMPAGMKNPKNEKVSLEEFAAFERWSDKQQAANADRLADEADAIARIKFHDAGLAKARRAELDEYEATPRATEPEVNLVGSVSPRRPRERVIQNEEARTVIQRPVAEAVRKPQANNWFDRFKGLFGAK